MKFLSDNFNKYHPIESREYTITKESKFTLRTVVSSATYQGEIGLVYGIECAETWQTYIGITSCHFEYQKNIGGGFPRLPRLAFHRLNLKKGIHPSRKMQQDWDMYGDDAFIIQALEIIPIFKTGSATFVWGSQATLRRLEAKWHNVFEYTYSKPSWSKHRTRYSRQGFSQEFIECLELELDFSYAPMEEAA